MPVWAYSLRMSMTSGPIEPEYTGSATSGLPLENDRVALLSEMFMTNFFSLDKRGRCGRPGSGPHQFKNLPHIRRIQIAHRLGAPQQQIQQVVVGQIHQAPQGIGLA